jgi:hypothetical protein
MWHDKKVVEMSKAIIAKIVVVGCWIAFAVATVLAPAWTWLLLGLFAFLASVVCPQFF